MTKAGLRKAATAITFSCLCLLVIGTAMAASSGKVKTSGGLTVYLGVVPAEIVKGPPPHSAERPMHGRIPRGPHEYHVVAAIFDAATGTRVSDASVSAQLSGIGLSGERKDLQPMQLSGTIMAPFSVCLVAIYTRSAWPSCVPGPGNLSLSILSTITVAKRCEWSEGEGENLSCRPTNHFRRRTITCTRKSSPLST